MTIGLVIRGKFRWSIRQHVVSQHRLQLTIDYDNETSSYVRLTCIMYFVKLSSVGLYYSTYYKTVR
jgi:hypothetical protein